MLQLEVVTPEGAKVKTEAAQVTAPGTVGDLGILPGHRPLLTSLGIGLLNYSADGARKWLAVNGGYMEVADDRVIIITETAEAPEQIDVERAEKALAKAKESLKAVDADEAEMVNVYEAAIKRSEARIAVSKHVKAFVPK